MGNAFNNTFLLIVVIFPLAVVLISAILYTVFKKLLIPPILICIGVSVLAFTLFNTAFLVYAPIYGLLSLLITFIAKFITNGNR